MTIQLGSELNLMYTSQLILITVSHKWWGPKRLNTGFIAMRFFVCLIIRNAGGQEGLQAELEKKRQEVEPGEMMRP